MNKPVSAPVIIVALLITLVVAGLIIYRQTTPPRTHVHGKKKAASCAYPFRA